MSLNATIEGEMSYNNRDSFEKAVEIVEQWEDEIEINTEDMKIVIPYGNYRNLVRYIDDACEYASDALVISVSFDGISHGFVDTHKNSYEIDLSVWHSEFPSNQLAEDNHEKYVEELQKVLTDFFNGGYKRFVDIEVYQDYDI